MFTIGVDGLRIEVKFCYSSGCIPLDEKDVLKERYVTNETFSYFLFFFNRTIDRLFHDRWIFEAEVLLRNSVRF